MSAILLIGCGRMGGALARGWSGTHEVIIFDPQAEAPPGTRRIERIDAGDLPAELVVVLAVKPQMLDSALPAIRPLAERGDLILSIMAGVTLNGLGDRLGGTRRIVRSMPNTPAAIGHGITAAVTGSSVSADDRTLIDTLLRAVGAVVWLDEEADLDAVTAVSGSGPAYFFRFTEALAKAGEAAGLPADIAMRLARATFTGSAALAAARPETLAELRVEVTSPGGTTAAGLARMDADGAIDRLAAETVAAAAARSRELGS
jgi:pyrroline-5-carboxylate reductase